MTRLYLQLNNPGSGETRINQNDPAAPDIEFGKFIRIVYRGEDRGGFFVDNIDQLDVAAGEEGERNVDVKGRGMLGIMDLMIVYWVNQGETTVIYSAKKIGFILDDLLTLAQARGSYPNLIWDFDAVNDSTGEAWTVDQDLSFRVGSTLLDAVEQFVELGVDFTMSFNPGANQYVLSAFKDGLGEDVSANVVFQPGDSILKASKLQEASGLRNVQLIEIADQSAGPLFVEGTRPVSIAAHGRREYFYQAGNAATAAQGIELGNADLDKLKDTRVQYSLVLSHAAGPRGFEDYNIGDIVGYLNSEGTVDLVQVISLQLDFTKEQHFTDVTVGLGVFIIDTEISSAQKLKKLAPGLTGSAGGGPTDPAVVAGALIGDHDSDVTSHFPYLRNANKIQDHLIIDPPAVPVDNDFMQYNSVNARWEYVSFAEAGLDARYVNVIGDTMTGQLFIDGAADEIQLLVQAHSTQTNNILEIQKSDTTVLSGADERGILFSHGGNIVSNFFAGDNAGNIAATGTSNIGIGSGALDAVTSGIANIGFGTNALGKLEDGDSNFALGSGSLAENVSGNNNLAIGNASLAVATGTSNVALGASALAAQTTPGDNVGIGSNAGQNNVTGANNTVIGTQAGIGVAGNSYSNNTIIGWKAGNKITTGSSNIFLGRTAAFRQTTLSNLLIIDNQTRANVATELTNSILYGVMAAAPADQILRINAAVTIPDSLFVDGSSDEVQFIVQAHSTQTNNLIELQDSGGNVDISFLGGGAVFNENSNNVNFRIESRLETHAFFIDGNAEEIGIFTDTPTGSLDISSGKFSIVYGANEASFLRTDAVTKVGNIVSPHYTNAEEPVMSMWMTAGQNNNILRLGGGDVGSNTVTVIQLYTAANNTTLTGTLRLSIGSNGEVVLNSVGSASADLIVGGGAEPNLLRVDAGLDVVRLGDWDTNYAQFAIDGELTLVGTAQVLRSMDLEPVLATRPIANPPGEGLEDGFATHDFNPTIDESVYFHLELPHDYAAGGLIHIHFDFFVDTAPASAQSVVWGVEYKKQSIGDNFDFGAGTTTAYTQTSVTTGTPANDKKVHESSEISLTVAGFVPGDYLLLRLFRDANGTGGTDDYTADARIIDYHIEYLSNRLGEAT